jgi:5-methylcytosine-specific restriction endonuclease McrA
MLQFAVRPEFMTKLNKIKSLAWHRLPANASLEQVFELAMDLMIEKEDPAKRIERREKRAPRSVPSAPSKNVRHIPAPIRDKVFQRDKGQCTFVAPGGRRCGSTQALQIDHIKPVARGGPATPDNLRLLCAQHNRFEAERLMGRHGPPR